MNHEQATRLLADFVAERLDREHRALVEAHLASCEDCDSWCRIYRTLADSLATETDLESLEHPSSELIAHFAVFPESLSHTEGAGIQNHLESCPDCLRQLQLSQTAVSRARRSVESWREPKGRSESEPSPRPIWLKLAVAAGLCLAVIGISALVYLRSSSDGAVRELSEMRLEGIQTIEADTSITAAQVEVEKGSQITFRAGERVTLGEGFSIGSDASFVVEITSTSRQRRTRADT